jgi:ribose transport system substrate-binding protein
LNKYDYGGERMRRKIISVLLCIALVATFMAGCSTKKTDEPSSSDNSSAAVTATPNDAAETNEQTEAPAAGSGAGATAKDQPIVKVQGVKVERPEGGYKFGFTSMDNSNPFFVTILNEIKSKVEANGDTLIVADPANDVSLQITQIEDMISQGIDAIFMNPAEAEGIAPALDELKAAGVPIINYDTEVANLEDYAFSYVGSDNYNAGKVCGEDMVKNFPTVEIS